MGEVVGSDINGLEEYFEGSEWNLPFTRDLTPGQKQALLQERAEDIGSFAGLFTTAIDTELANVNDGFTEGDVKPVAGEMALQTIDPNLSYRIAVAAALLAREAFEAGWQRGLDGTSPGEPDLEPTDRLIEELRETRPNATIRRVR